MFNDNSKGAERSLIEFLNSLIRERLVIYFKKKNDSASDERLVRTNAFYAKVLYDVAFGAEPSLEQFEDMGFKESDEGIFQGALYLFKKWAKLGLTKAVTNYCQYVNRLLDGRILGFVPRFKVALPDFCEFESEILAKIYALKSMPVPAELRVLGSL